MIHVVDVAVPLRGIGKVDVLVSSNLILDFGCEWNYFACWKVARASFYLLSFARGRNTPNSTLGHFNAKMASRGGPRAAGTDGTDFTHREIIKEQYYVR